MRNTFHFTGIPLLLTLSLFVFVFQNDARAQETATQESAAPVAVSEILDPLTVGDVTVDKTAENAVVAREQAMVEAQRLAFQRLAERNLSPEELASFSPPDDQTILSLVQDFEIKKEQLSATRYVASFTVRFRNGVRGFIRIKPSEAVAGDETEAETNTGEESSENAAGEKAAGPAATRTTLILPYFEDISGRTLLWEDQNPWRQVWQSAGTQTPFLVPLGDIADIGTGDSNGVWSGDYRAVEKLRRNYGADQVALAVANKSGPSMIVDVYVYSRNDGLKRLSSLTPYVGDRSEDEALRLGAEEVLKVLRAPPDTKTVSDVEDISREITSRFQSAREGAEEAMPESGMQAPEQAAQASPAVANGRELLLDAAMSFESFSQWMELQRRLTAATPPVRLDIKSLSKNEARFALGWNGDVDSLRRVLQDNGVMLDQPVIEVGESLPGYAQTTRNTIYTIGLSAEVPAP